MTIKSRTNTAAQPVTKSNPNPRPNPNPATKQYAIVQSQLNIVTCPTYPQKFTRDNVVAPFVQTSIVIATLPKKFVCKQLAQGYHTVRSWSSWSLRLSLHAAPCESVLIQWQRQRSLRQWPTDSCVTVAEETAVDAADNGMNDIHKTSRTNVRLQNTHNFTKQATIFIFLPAQWSNRTYSSLLLWTPSAFTVS